MKSLILILEKLSLILNKRYKIYMLMFIFLTIFLSIVETISVSIIMPFISIASNTESLNTGIYKAVYEILGFSDKISFIIFLGFLIIAFFIFRGLFNLVYSYILNRFIFKLYNEISFLLFQRYLNMPYKYYVDLNSASLTKNIVNEAYNVSFLIHNVLLLFSEIFIIIFIYFFLLYIDWKLTLILSIMLSFKGLVITNTLSKILKSLGEKKVEVQERLFKLITETFGNFKYIKIIGNENLILKLFKEINSLFSKYNTIAITLQALPRNVLENMGFSILIAFVMYILYIYKSINFVLPVLSAYGMALYRILPAFNRIITYYNTIFFYIKSFDIIYEDINSHYECEGEEPIKFENSIKLEDVSFSYDGKFDILKNIFLEIKKGEKVVFIGSSGAGKSTLIDIIIGIYKPSKGRVLVDGIELNNENIKSWRKKIGYIPQNIYLFDGTVAENVSFGCEIDEKRVIEVLKKVNIYDFIEKKEGIYTRVGEGGIQLSGGQKQRIAIARALYKDPEIIVLDEATSALDIDTEAKILDALYEIAKDKTLLIITHRTNKMHYYDKIIKVENGNISIMMPND